jgi:hypothetical protein
LIGTHFTVSHLLAGPNLIGIVDAVGAGQIASERQENADVIDVPMQAEERQIHDGP